MRIDRRNDIAPTRLHIRQEADQRRSVIAFGKAFFLHQAFAAQHRIGAQEAIGGHQLHFRRIGPARQQRLQHARRRRFADRDGAGDADNIGHLAVVRAEKPLRRLEQALCRRDIKGEQARQRQIDGDHFVERNGIVHRLQLAQIVDGEGELRIGAQFRPFVAGEAAKGRGDRLGHLRWRRIVHREP